MQKIKSFIRDAIYVFLNYIIAYIPIWFIRRFFYQLFGMKIGRGTRINMKCIVMSPWKIEIGENTMVNEYTLLDGRGGLKIGNSCSISMWVVIYTASHYANSSIFQYYSKPTQIGNCCWLGTRCVIMPGSTLSDRTIISVNSVYKGHSEENGIYEGNPTILKRYRALKNNYEQKNEGFFK